MHTQILKIDHKTCKTKTIKNCNTYM